MKKIIIVLFITLSLCSCFGAQSGVKISRVDFDSFEKGKATRAQVIEQFGDPQVITTLQDGSIQIICSYGQSEVNPATCIPTIGMLAHSQTGETVTASFLFDAVTNKLVQKSYKTTNFSTNVKK